MQKYIIAFLLFLTFCAVSVPASAQVSRLYFAGYMGLTTSDAMNFKNTTPARNGDVQMDNTMNFAGALGLRLTSKLRLEGEISYRSAENDQLDFSGGPSNAGASGDFNAWIGMANIYYDFDVPWDIKPYVGAGIGIGSYEYTLTDGSSTIGAVSDDQTSLVWNAAAGLKYRPRSDLAYTFGYRYLDGGDIEFNGIDLDYASHEFRIGLEWDLPPSY